VANIIIIEHDPKVRRQMESMLLEVNADNKFASYDAAEEFEKAFLPAAPKRKAFNEDRYFADFKIEQIQTILSHTISDVPSFTAGTLTLTIDKDMQNIVEVDPTPADGSHIFGFTADELKGPLEKITNMIPESFRGIWKDAFENVVKEKMASASIVIMSIDKNLSLLDVQWAIDSQKRFVLSIQDLNKNLRPIVAEEKAWREEQEKLALEQKIFPTIDLVLVRMDSLKEKPKDWAHKVKSEVRQRNLVTPERGDVRIVLLKFEEDGISKLDLLDPQIDDLIYLPLDRSLFLQKIDIILSLPTMATPRFLFNQAIEIEIEVSKLTKVEKISDIALAIRNPTRLMTGMLGHFYFIFPNQKDIIEVFGKVYKSEPHPEHPGEYLVYFFFFGIKKSMLAQIRNFLSRIKSYHSLLTEIRDKFEFNPDDLFMSEDLKRVREVVVIDYDVPNLQHVIQNVTTEFDQVRVVKESSYAAFLKKYARGAVISKVAHPPIDAQELYAESVKFKLDPENFNMVELMTPGKDEDVWLGYTVADLKGDPQTWKRPFTTNEQQESLVEAKQLAMMSGKHRTVLEIQRQNGDVKLVGCEIIYEAATNTMTFSYHAPLAEEVVAFTGDSEAEGQLQKLDLLIVDAGFIGANIQAWLDGLYSVTRQKGLIGEKERLRIMVLVEEHQTIDLKKYAQPEFLGMIYKHGDVRSMLVQISQHMDNRFTIYNSDNVGWASVLFNIHVAKDIHLEQISEFGVTIRHPRPIRPGTYLFMRKSIFNNAPNQCLAARFYASHEHTKYPGEYACSALYYGINDTFMKFARQWFRETYAQSKQKESSGGGE